MLSLKLSVDEKAEVIDAVLLNLLICLASITN